MRLGAVATAGGVLLLCAAPVATPRAADGVAGQVFVNPAGTQLSEQLTNNFGMPLLFDRQTISGGNPQITGASQDGQPCTAVSRALGVAQADGIAATALAPAAASAKKALAGVAKVKVKLSRAAASARGAKLKAVGKVRSALARVEKDLKRVRSTVSSVVARSAGAKTKSSAAQTALQKCLAGG